MTLIHHPVAHVQTLKYLELTDAQRKRFTEDQSNAGVVITKAQHARDWDIGDLNMLKRAARCEHVLAVRPTGATMLCCSRRIMSEKSLYSCIHVFMYSCIHVFM